MTKSFVKFVKVKAYNRLIGYHNSSGDPESSVEESLRNYFLTTHKYLIYIFSTRNSHICSRFVFILNIWKYLEDVGIKLLQCDGKSSPVQQKFLLFY